MQDIQLIRYGELSRERREALATAADRAFQQVPIVRTTTWATPDWSVIATVDDRLACFYNLVLRTVRLDGSDTRVAGLNNLVTLPAYRGQGLASALLRETERLWFRTLEVEYGLLLCADALVPFYAQLGWQRLRSEVRFAQPGAPSLRWAADCMLLHPQRRPLGPATLDLAGLPW